MVTIPLNLTGGTYKHNSLGLSAERNINWWPRKQKPTARSPYILDSFPGKKLFGTATGARDRGMKEHLGILYKVTDTTLYTVDSAGAHTARGTIAGVERCIIEGIGTNIIIVAGGTVYQWDGSTLTTVTDIDLETPNSCAHLNNVIIYDGDNGRFATSDVGDATSISGLNYATAESNADDLKRVYVHDQKLYLFSDKTIELWWFSGVGKPPLDRIDTLRVGLGALYSVANSRELIYFLGDDNLLYAMKENSIQLVFNDAIAEEVAGFTTTSDAVGMCYQINGQWFYEISYLTQNRTFCYPEGGEAFELSSGSEGGRNIASSHAFVFGKNLVGDINSGNIYELDPKTYTENGAAIIRTRDTAPLHGGLLSPQAEGKHVTINSLELVMEVGQGLLTGQGENPIVMLSWSDDGGNTFSTERWKRTGTKGQFKKTVRFENLGRFKNRVFRIRVSDPVYYAIYTAIADVEIGI